MSSPAPFTPARSIAARRRSLGDRLAMALGLSAGAAGTSSLAQAGDADAPRTPHTLLLPEHYKIFEGGTAVFALESGEQLSLTSDQYVLLDGGLLLVVDELVQHTMSQLPVRGSLRTQLLTEVEPVRNQDGNIIEVSSTLPLWSGDVSQPGLFEEIDLQTYELAQNAGSDAADAVASLDDSGGLSLLAGASLLALSVGLFGLLPREDEDEGSSTGGGSDGGGTTFSGTVIKGPLVNAFVFLDENGNGLFDAGEPNFTTSSTGSFSISSSAANPKLIVTTNDQTIDTTTGTVLSGMTFTSPAGASVVSPLTTMMEETGLSAAQIKSVLGLPASVNPLTFNPYGPGVNAADALATEQASAQTMATLAAFAAAAAGTGISQQDAFAAALSALSTVMQSKSSSGASLDLSDATDVAAVQSAFTTAAAAIPGVTGAQTTAMAGIIGDATTAIQNVNAKIASITNTDLSDAANGNIFGLLQVLQDQVEKAAEDETATPGSGSIGFTDPTAVDNAATNSPPTDIALSAASISEDAASLVVGVLTTTDDTTTDFNFTYEIAEIEGSTDHAAFTIDQTNGELKFVSQPDFETQSSYTITIKATDGGGKSFSETFTITVTDGNEPPVFDPASAFSTPENQLGTGVTPMATDQNGDTLSYSIVGGADGDKFELDGTTGELKFKVAPNFEANGSANGDNDYIVQIQADDDNGGTATQTFTITVTDANDPPVFTSSASHSVQENQSDTGYTPVAVHPQGLSFTFSIGGGADADKFELVGGVLQFKDDHIPDYENPTDSDGNRIYDVQIHATDSAGSIATQDVTITVTDVVNEHDPVFTSGTTFSAEENQLQTGYTPAATDADGDTVSFSINGGADAELFELDDVTGELKFRTTPDYENPTDSGGDRTYNVQILASDGAGRSATQNVSITLTDVDEPNQPPTFTSGTSFNAAENQVLTGYTPAATDPENDSVTFGISGGADASLFELDGVSGALKFKSAPNFEVPTDSDTNNIYQIEVEADDGNGGTATQSVTITVTDEAEAPADPVITSGSTASAPENQVATGYTPTATDADGDTVTFTINGGADANKFELDGVSGALNFKVAPDYEANGSANNDNDYIVQILASDGTGRTDTQTVTVSVTDVVEANQPPTITSGGTATAAENQVTTNYTPTATDPENDSVSFSIIGGADADLFELDGVSGALKFKAAPDFEAQGSADNDNVYEVQIQASDGNGGTDTQTVNVTVTDENEGPDFTIISSFSAAENQIETGYTPTATDEDGDTITYTISGGADAGKFELVEGTLKFKAAPDFENPTDASSPPDNVYEVQIQADDGNGGTATQAANISVTNVNEVPSFTSGTTSNAAENQLDTGYTPAATDPENDTVTFTINGGADADKFELVGGALKFKTAPDFDTPGSADNDNVYEVQIQASDGNGGTATQSVSITVTDVAENQAPIFSSGTTSSVPENQSSAGYTATAEDPDGTLETVTRNITTLSGTPNADLLGEPYYVGYEGTLSSGNSVWRVENKLDTTTTFQFHREGNIYLKTVEVLAGTTALVETPHTGLGHGVWVPYYPVGDGLWASGRAQGDEQAFEYTTEEVQVRTGVTLTYSIVGGADQGLFNIDSASGALTFKAAPDYEIPADSDTNNVYEIQIEVNDGTGGTATQTVSIAVTDKSEPTFSSSSASINFAENGTGTVYTAVATDADGETPAYHLVGGADQALFDLDSSSGALTFKAAPDYETPADSDTNNVYEVQIEARDGNGGTASQTVSVTVTDVDENPIQSTDISSLKLIGAGVTNDFTFGEKLQPIGTVLGDLNGDGGDEFVLAGSQPTDTPGSFHLIAGLLNTSTLDDEIDLDAYHPRKVTVENDLGSKRFGVAFASGEGLTSVGSKDLLVYRGGNFEASNGYGTFDSRAYLFDAQDLLSNSAGTTSTSLSATTYADFYNIQGAPLFGLATGDFNGDGTADIHFGSHHHNSGGKSHLVTGDGFYTFGQSYDVLSLVASQGFSTDGVNDLGGGPFAGDFDADGFDDLIVNGYNHKVTGSLSASVYVVWGNDTFTLGDTYNLYSAADPKWTMIHGSGGQSLIEVSTVQSGDFIGTTTPDLVISARNIDKTYRDLYIIDGDELANRPNEINLSALATNQGVHLTGIHLTDQAPATAGEILQIHTAVLDDLDGDGKSEIGFASSKSNGTDAEVGIVYSQSIAGLSAPFDFSANSNTVTTVDDDVSTTRFGTTIWRAGDVDGDGVQDYGIGFADETAGKEGAHIISGAGLVTPGSSLTVTEPNGRPVFASGTSFNAAENQLETGYTPAATDPENDSVTFTINGGADADKFELVGGALKFKQTPDFDTPGSADNDNVYEVQILASDGNGGTATQSVSITVTDVIEAANTAPSIDPFVTFSNGGEQKVGDGTYHDTIAVSSGGFATAWIWTGTSDESGAYLRYIDQNGAFDGEPIYLGRDGEASQPDPNLVELSNGTLALSFTENRDGEREAELRLITGNSVVDVGVVSPGDSGDYLVAGITDLGNQRFVVTWNYSSNHPSSLPSGLYGQEITYDGSLIGTPFPLSPTQANTFGDVAGLLNSDQLIVVWQDRNGGDELYASGYDIDTKQALFTTQVSTGGSSQAISNFTSTVTSDGFVVSWIEGPPGPGLIQKFDSNGQPASAPIELGANLFAVGKLDSIDTGPIKGGFSISWSDFDKNVFHQVFDSNLQAATDAFAVAADEYQSVLGGATQNNGPSLVTFHDAVAGGVYFDLVNHVQQSPYTVTENADVSTVILDINATDAENDTLQYSVTGTDAALVTIDTDDGEVRLNAPADYETKSSYSFTVNVTDGELTDSQDVTVEVIDVAEPHIISQLTSGYQLFDVEIAPDLDSDGMNELVVHRKVAKYDRQAFIIEDELLNGEQTTNLDTVSSEFVLRISGLRHSSRLDLHSDFVDDFNGDGLSELVLGDHDSSTGGQSVNGQVYFVSGSELIAQSGSMSADYAISIGGMKMFGEKYGDYLGWSVSTIIDERSDTYAQSLLLASAERSVTVAAGSNKGGLDQFKQTGLEQIFEQNGQGSSVNIGTLSSHRNEILGISVGDGFPSDARIIGDLNRDGVEDVLALPRWGEFQQTAFLSGSQIVDGTPVDLSNLSSDQGYMVSNAGFSPKGSFSIDQINSDNFADAVIYSNSFDAGSGLTGGTIFVLKSGDFFANASSPDQWSSDGHITINSSQGIYLSDATEIPDISGDGVSEIAFGTNSSSSADKTGIYVIYSDFLTSAAGDYNMESLSSDQMTFVPTSTALYDLEAGNFDTDASPELVVTTSDGQSVYVVNMHEFSSWSGGDLF